MSNKFEFANYKKVNLFLCSTLNIMSETPKTVLQSNSSSAMSTNEGTSTPTKKKRILKSAEYASICYFIQHYQGLAIDCELEMVNHVFQDVERHTLKSILQTELTTRLRSQHWQYEARGKQYLQAFEDQVATHPKPTLLIKIANMEGITPVALCRTILQQKYKFEHKSHLSRLIKYPHLIEDPKLAANVAQCLCSDSQDGPLIDFRRRVLGEEYEFRLKELATAAGLHYYDENDLRRLGYDKTPDIKMIVPFLYKGEVINWIESKATFGDVKTHKWYIHQQLYSYSNRFGAGIVIYWFGYHEETVNLTENNVGIIVLCDFPASDELVILNLTNETNVPDKATIDNSNISLPENNSS